MQCSAFFFSMLFTLKQKGRGYVLSKGACLSHIIKATDLLAVNNTQYQIKLSKCKSSNYLHNTWTSWRSRSTGQLGCISPFPNNRHSSFCFLPPKPQVLLLGLSSHTWRLLVQHIIPDERWTLLLHITWQKPWAPKRHWRTAPKKSIHSVRIDK